MMKRLLQLLTGLGMLLSPVFVWALEKAPVASAPAPLGAISFFKVLASLLVVLMMIAAMAWLLRRVNQVAGGSGAVLRVIGAVSVGGRERVVLVQVGEQQLLLGVSPGSVQTLHVLEKPVVQATFNESGESFAAKLNAALKRARGES